MRLNVKESLYESFKNNLKEIDACVDKEKQDVSDNKEIHESTNDKEWEEVCKEFCKQIGAELLFVNDDNFGYQDKDGSLVHMYADELETYLKNRLNESKLLETTNKGIEAKQQDLYDRIRQALKHAGDKDWENIVGYKNRLPQDVAEAFEREDRELWCIEMVHSILTYSSDRNIDTLIKNKYLKKYIDELGEDRVREILADEIEEYKNATINKGTYTDSEDVTYNSVTFSDD